MLPELTQLNVKNNWQKTHLDNFVKMGWPSSKNEDWKFTSLSQMLKKPVEIALTAQGDDARHKMAPSIQGACRVVFRNGIYDSEMSGGNHSNIVISNLIEDDDAISFLNEASLSHHPVFNLTIAAMQSAILIDIDASKTEPISVIDLSFVGGLINQSSHPLVMIRIAKNATVRISETHASKNGLSAPIVILQLDDGAVCDHVRCQIADLDSSQLGLSLVNQNTGSDYRSFSLTSGGDISRTEMHLNLNGENASCHLSSIYLGCEDQHMDITTRLYHNVANCKSEQVIRGVLDDRARGVFQGKIRVAPDAQKTDGQQMTRALLLSRETEADTKPELEIFADDVVCSHGATIGEIDEHQLFYLVSRGIPVMQARSMLIEAFLIGTLSQIRVPELESQVEYYIQDWISNSAQMSALDY